MPTINLSNIKKKDFVLFCIALGMLIPYSFYRNIFCPLRAKVKGVSAQIEQRKRDIQTAKVSPQALDGLKNEINKLKAQIDDYQKGLKAQADVPQILKELNQIAESLKIKFVSVTPLERKETLFPGGGGLLLQIPIRIKLQCGYHQLGIFINQIENSSQFMKITQLAINADASNIWAHQAELVITSYSLVSK